MKSLETQVLELHDSLQQQTTQNSTLSISISQYLNKNNDLEMRVKSNDDTIANYLNIIKTLTSEKDTVLEELQELQKVSLLLSSSSSLLLSLSLLSSSSLLLLSSSSLSSLSLRWYYDHIISNNISDNSIIIMIDAFDVILFPRY